MRNVFTPIVSMICYEANSIDAFIPELWANESLNLLAENMVVANLVHRDFENVLADFGDVVNTRKPGTFSAKRKDPGDDVTIQSATATNIQVPLDQQVHVSFMIRDAQASKSFKNLVTEFLAPALLAQAQYLDMITLGQMYRFHQYSSKIGTAVSRSTTLDARMSMNDLNLPNAGRNLILTSAAETGLLKGSDFEAAKGGPDPALLALRDAYVGRVSGFDTYMCQNAPVITTSEIGTPTTITEVAAVGDTSLTMADRSELTAGTFFVVHGDDIPHVVVTTGSSAGVITCTPAIQTACLDNAVVDIGGVGAVNQSSTAVADSGLAGTAGYAVGWTKTIIINGFSVAPQVGQVINFGTNTDPTKFYSVIEATTTTLVLDRPLHTAVAHSAVIHVGVLGQYNFAFRRNAIALVVRPLIMPQASAVRAAVVNLDGLSVRVCVSYDAKAQGHLVTVDMLCGVALLESSAGLILLS